MENISPDSRIYNGSIEETRHPVRINKQRRIGALRDKAEITGFRYIRPKTFELSKKQGRKGEIYFEKQAPFTIDDVDGNRYHTVRTSYLQADKHTPYPQRKTQYGVYKALLSPTYHGKLSVHWKQDFLTSAEVIDALNSGYSLAPGIFIPPHGESQRSAKFCLYRTLILFDADEWTSEHPAPRNLDDFIFQYPDAISDFYWVGESVSSRSSLKPELRLRLMLVLPTPIYLGQTLLWETAIDWVCQKYPFIARGVGIDQCRLSFGNARPDCENRVFGGLITPDTFAMWEQITANNMAQQQADAAAQAEREKTYAHRREASDKVRVELENRGHTFAPGAGEPISEFIKQDPAQLLTAYQIGTHLRDREWNYHASSPGRSFELLDGGTLYIYSNSMRLASPEPNSTAAISAHRFIAYEVWGLDMTKESDRYALRKQLAEAGYGQDPDEWQKIQREIRHAARSEGLIAPNSKPQKLHKSDAALTLQTLNNSRDFIKQVFESHVKIFALRADTGVGKGEKAIQYVYRGIKLLLNFPHKILMHEFEIRFNTAEIPPFAYRGIMSNPDGEFPDENPCKQGWRYDAYSKKGGNPLVTVCAGCQFFSTCEEGGHRYDLRQLQKHQVNLFTFPQLFTNPIYRPWIKNNIGTLEKDDLILHDDVEITSLYNVIEVSRDYLEDMSRRHQGTNTGSFADILLSCLHRDDRYEKIRYFMEGITDSEREEIIEGLSHVRIDGKMLSLDDAVERGHYRLETRADFDAMPQVQKSDWTLVQQLELFFDMYPHAANAPIRYNEGILYFALAPILPKTKARFGFMGATLQEEHFRRTFPQAYYPNVMFFDALSTQWHPEARVYQLATNRNPRRTVLTDEKLNTTGEAYWQSVIDIVNRLEGTHGIITYETVLAEKETDIEKHGLMTAHFGALTGLDNRFEDMDYLHILFSPERPPIAHQWDAKMIFGADRELLDFKTRNEKTGEWDDKRVQSVYDMGVIAELIQAVGRGRLVIFGKKVFLWCSHYLPTITDREQTHLFMESDIEKWTDNETKTLEKIIQDRQKEQNVIKNAEKAGDVNTVVDLTGVSKREARRRTETQRKNNKTERNAAIKRMHTVGIEPQQIAMETGLHITTIKRILGLI